MLTEIQNIVHVYATATDTEHEQGAAWYDEAHALALALSPHDVMRGAGVIAAYSPLTPWWRNKDLAIGTFAEGKARTDTLGNSARAAQRILDGEPVPNVLKGLKTLAFASNIAGDLDAVTVDSHAYSVAIGVHTFSKDVKMGIRRYREIAAAYVAAAALVGERPAILQAITWVSWRNDNVNAAARKGDIPSAG